MDIALITYQLDTNPAGVGVHVENIVKNIIALDRHNTYHLLHFNKHEHPVYEHREIIYKHYKHLPVMFSDSWFLFKHPHRFDIVHRFLPGGFIFNIPSKKVITVHDLFMYKSYPFNRKLKILLARFFNLSSLKKADAVIAVSEYTKQEIQNTFAIDDNKLHVVYNASRNLEMHNKENSKILQSTYELPSDYILFVSTVEPRKNLLTLIKAFEILKERFAINESLVILGQKGWDSEDTFRYIKKSIYRPFIKYIGYVPISHLGSFYKNARLFVYPSFMEGFGMPPLEAMTCGCPTLTSNTSSLPEVVQYPEMMFDPENVEELVSKCVRILKDPTVREDNIAKGAENAQRFSWKASAEKIIKIYNALGTE